MELRPRSFLAPNASPMTLAGTITYVVGRRRVAIIDPGSAQTDHLAALAGAAADAASAVIIITHDHPDHSPGGRELADRLGAPLVDGAVPDGTAVATDDGELIVLRTPGHSPDHIALHWPAAAAIFCGDLMMGGLDTAVVAAPEGDVGDYLASLERLRALRPRTVYPAHGPAFTDPDEALGRYLDHRIDRLRQVAAAMDAGADDPRSIADSVYGPTLDPALRPFAEAAIEAYAAYLRQHGRAILEERG